MKSEWPTVKLGEIVFEERLPVGTFDGNGLPVLGVTNVDGVTHTGVTASEDLSKYLRLKPGRFVYNPYRINVGSLGLSSETQDGITSPAYVVFAPGERVEAKFLHYYLKSARGSQLINFHGNRGTVRSALRFNDLCQIEITLPPLAEQRRIVKRIEELAAPINEARALRQQAAEEAGKILKIAVRLSVQGSDPTGKLLDVLSAAPRNGWSARCDNAEGGVPVLSLRAITGFRYRSSEFKRTSLHVPRETHIWLQPGDILITRSNTPELVGHAAIYNGDPAPCIYPDLMMRLELNDCADSRFVWYWLQSSLVREFISKNAKGTSPTMKKISQRIVMSMPFPSTLTLTEQRRIVAELDALQTEVDTLKRLQAETAAELDALLPSVLDRAFKGDL
jgi:type I restriction enzyme S subunit